jgi:hypothetical protein
MVSPKPLLSVEGGGEERRWSITVELQEVFIAGLGGQLLGVDDGLLESVALRNRHVEVVWNVYCILGLAVELVKCSVVNLFKVRSR